MRRLMSLAMLIAACASISLAQTTDDYNKYDIFVGYSHNRVDTGIGDNDPQLDDIFDEREGFHGFNTSVTGNVSRYIGFKGDLSGHWKKKTFPFPLPGSTASVELDSSLWNFLGGVQLKDNSKEARIKPFAHALAGLAYGRVNGNFNVVCPAVVGFPCPTNFEESDTGFAAAIGGGLDIRASERIDIRAFQLDYNPTRIFDGGTQHNFRVGVGIVFR